MHQFITVWASPAQALPDLHHVSQTTYSPPEVIQMVPWLPQLNAAIKGAVMRAVAESKKASRRKIAMGSSFQVGSSPPIVTGGGRVSIKFDIPRVAWIPA